MAARGRAPDGPAHVPRTAEHDLSHLDAYQAAARLVIGNRETAAFTLHTRPPRPVVGAATHIRAACAAASGNATDPTAIEQLAKRLAGSDRGKTSRRSD